LPESAANLNQMGIELRLEVVEKLFVDLSRKIEKLLPKTKPNASQEQ